MTDLFIDREPAGVKQSVQTWADVLTDLDAQLDARGRVLTEVQFDGVGEPTYREPHVLARRLSTLERIDVATTTPEALLTDCLRESAGSVNHLRAESMRTAGLFRLPDVAPASERLAWIASELGQLMVLVRTLQGPLGIVTADPDGDSGAEVRELARFGALLESLLDAQRTGDHYAIADILEYDLTPFLQAWQTRFEALAA